MDTQSANHENPLKGFEQSARWPHVWLKAVALAWFDEEFKQQLMEDPRLAMSNAFGFEVPAGLDLQVKEVVPVAGDPERDWGWRDGRWTLPDHEVTMILPAKPTEHLRVEAVALANYAEMGRTHPFTFCL